MGQLKRLRDEFDFSYSASLQFHVEPSRAALDLTIDFLFGQPHTSQCIFYGSVRTVNVFLNRGSESRKKLVGTCRSATANQSLAFPCLRSLFVVLQNLIKRTRQRTIATVWPQTQV